MADVVHKIDVVDFSFEELVSAQTTTPSPLLESKIAEAYGFDGLGILTVKNVPGLEDLRMRLLPLAHQFANLPDEVKAKTEVEHSFYQVGWSHGNEKLQGNKPDYAKGSYYCNPLLDTPSTDQELIKKYPSFLEPNVWPSDDLPDFEGAFKDLGQLVVSVGRLIAKLCDRFVESQCEGYEKGKLFKLLNESKCCKGRLLHYYSVDEVEKLMGKTESNDSDFSDWCGWHNDHGSLTGLVPAIYTNKEGKVCENPDPLSGLYVRSRSGKLVKVNLPKEDNCISFQIGETSQIHSGGLLQATPHAVRGASGEKARGISRQTFAVFMEPEYDGTMELPAGKTVEDVQTSEAAKHLPASVRTLASRWKKGQDFGEFSEATFSAFY